MLQRSRELSSIILCGFGVVVSRKGEILWGNCVHDGGGPNTLEFCCCLLYKQPSIDVVNLTQLERKRLQDDFLLHGFLSNGKYRDYFQRSELVRGNVLSCSLVNV